LKEIIENREQYMNLLLEADPSKNMIEKYLHKGRMFAIEKENKVICVAIVIEVNKDTCELKNISTVESEQNKGYAGDMIKFLFDEFSKKYSKMIVGTTETMLPWYVLKGFTRYSHKIINFFVDNYKEKLFEGKHQCVDMFYLEKEF
jgi:N-acetylglutamate synthase-like GNAT family acetyltransferase